MTGPSRRQLARYAVDSMVAGVPPAKLSAHLAASLVSSGRHGELELLISDIDQELEDRRLLARVRLTSARPLPAAAKRETAQQLKKMLGVKSLDWQYEIDKSVIGGLKIETPSRSWDKTVKRTLTGIKGAK